MPSVDNTDPIENVSRSAYDGRAEVRFAAMETRLAAVEVDVAVIRTSFATKNDVAEHRAEFSAALDRQHEEFNMALKEHRVELRKTLMSHLWRVYGLVIVLLGGVYFIARYVH